MLGFKRLPVQAAFFLFTLATPNVATVPYYCSTMNIHIVGTGNVAQVVGSMLRKANHSILQVYGRNPQATAACAARLGAKPVSEISQLSQEAHLCLIATSDEAVAEVSNRLSLPYTIVVHTSGGVGIQAVSRHRRHGVLYPLQSLRKELPYLPDVPFFVDGSDDSTRDAIFALARTISSMVQYAKDTERLKLHVAAVFCSNFTNHLFALSELFCRKENLSFDCLMPLMHETVHRMAYKVPSQLQTGPAARGDEATIQRHLAVLQPYPMMAEMYATLTASIRQKAAED